MPQHTQTTVKGSEEIVETQLKRKEKVFWIFDVEWWETVSAKHIGNDIYIMTDRPIRNIYLNGKKW